MKYFRSHIRNRIAPLTKLQPVRRCLHRKKGALGSQDEDAPNAFQSFTQLEQQLESELENARIVRRLRLQETISKACRIRRRIVRSSITRDRIVRDTATTGRARS